MAALDGQVFLKLPTRFPLLMLAFRIIRAILVLYDSRIRSAFLKLLGVIRQLESTSRRGVGNKDPFR